MYTLLQEVKIRLRQFKRTAEGIIFTDPEEDDVLESFIEANKSVLLNALRIDVETSEEVLNGIFERYRWVLVELTIYDYSKEGAEYQYGHDENGISRRWRDKDQILATYHVTATAKLV